MSKATDPFEEYLRKKKVEMLETKYREEGEKAAAAEEDDGLDGVPSNDDPEVEARLKEEVDEFFSESKSAGAELFSKAGSNLIDEKVEEIRDALDDVFEDDAPAPRMEPDDGTFVDFFRQVRNEYDPTEEPETLLPEKPELEPDPEPEPAPVEEAEAVAEVAPPPPHPTEVLANVAEVSTDEIVAVEVPEDRVDSRLTLQDVLTPITNETELLQRVELLGRLIAKLAERAKLPENELIEVLIRSGVEF